MIPFRNSAISSIATVIAILAFTSTLILPAIKFTDNFPKVEPVDICLPIIFLLLVIHNWKIFFEKRYKILIPLLVFFIAMILSIVVNDRIYILRDHFELLKIIKFFLIIHFFSLVVDLVNWDKWITITFIVLLVFNFLHYIDFLGFNSLIQIYYGAEIHIAGFGLNSLGEPDTKRILGTLGNPNNNAILFLFFCIYYFKNSLGKNPILFYLAAFGLLACQSRTGFIAFGFIFLLFIYLNRVPLKLILQHIVVIAIEYFLFLLIGNMYISSLANSELLKSNSVLGRIETWTYLGKMILEKPFFGYGPDKLYFENHNLYSESEYFLIAWRYGFLGLISYLWFMLRTVFCAFNFKQLTFVSVLFFYTIVLLITGLTNNPFSDPKLMVLFAMVLGLSIGDYRKQELINSAK